jgi:hypothetical protein
MYTWMNHTHHEGVQKGQRPAREWERNLTTREVEADKRPTRNDNIFSTHRIGCREVSGLFEGANEGGCRWYG